MTSVGESSLYEVLRRTARFHPDKVAIRWEGDPRTYEQLADRTTRLASGLHARGVRAGDRIAVLLRNGPDFLEAYYASVALGTCFVPLDFRLAPEELTRLLGHCTPTALIFDSDFSDRLSPNLGEEVEGLRVLVSVGDQPTGSAERYEVLLAAATPDGLPTVDVEPSEAQCILYTAGTTGSPKGAIRTRRAVFWGLFMRAMILAADERMVSLTAAPMFHLAGLEFMTLTTLMAGGTVVSRRRFDPVEFAATIEQERVTHTFAVPTMSAMLLDAGGLDGRDISSLGLYISAGAPLSSELRDRLVEAIRPARLWNMAGSTEGGIWGILKEDRILHKGASCIGWPAPGVDIRVVDDAGNEVEPGAVGELICKSPDSFDGYWRAPEATQDALRDGWYYSGDLAKLDEERCIYLIGRKRDMIITGGENVLATEVEDVLQSIPGVGEVAVIGMPDPVWGERVTAVVVPTRSGQLESHEVVAQARARLAGFKCPREVVFVDALPHNSFGKVVRHALRDQLIAER